MRPFRFACPASDCDHIKNGLCTWHWACRYGLFAHMVERHLSTFGHWRIRQYADGAIVASLHGKRGRVEVWGGDMHRREVWALHKNGKEHLLAVNWHTTDGGLEKYVEQACHELSISVQTKIPERRLMGKNITAVIVDEWGEYGSD